jgi:hypothetical protein
MDMPFCYLTLNNHFDVIVFLMKCISLRQPYAKLLANGKKTIDAEACKYYVMSADKITIGAIIGKVVIYGVKKYRNNNEFELDKNKNLSLRKLVNDKHMYDF